MNKHYYSMLFVGLLLSLPTIHHGLGQTVPLRFHQLSLAEGLPHSMVNHVMQDSQGFMWFSTHGGLSRYDGYTFRTFTPQFPDSAGLLYYEIESALEDAHRNIWIRYSAGGLSRYNMLSGQISHYRHQADSGSIAGDFVASNHRSNTLLVDRQQRGWFRTTQGLSRYVDSTDRFVNYTHRPGDTTSLPHNHINHLFEDSQGHLWVATQGGLGRLDETSQHFRNYYAEADGLGHNTVLFVYEDRAHYLWVGTQDGLGRSAQPLGDLPPARFVNYRPVAQPHHHTNTIHQITVDRRGHLWLATNRGAVRAWQRDAELQFQTYLDDSTHLDITGAHHVKSLYQDSRGNLWAHAYPGKRGLFRYDPTQDRFVSLRHQASTYDLPTEAISYLYEGQSGMLWFATWRSGVLKVDLHAQPFVHYQSGTTQDNDVYAIHQRDTSLWIGTANGLYHHHLPTSRTNKIPYSQDKSLDYPKIVGAIAYDSVHRSLWLGYYDYKLSRWNLKDQTATYYHYQNNRAGRYPPWSVRTIHSDRSGRIWVGAATDGLHYYDRASDRFYEYPLPVPDLRFVEALHLQDDSLLWIGTMQHGLHRLSLSSGRLVSFGSRRGRYLPTDDVAAIVSIGEQVWVGTAHGLVQIDEHLRVKRHYTTTDGLGSNDIKALATDPRGRLWISTNDGLACFDPADQSFVNYYTHDGLPSNEFNQGASFVAPDGTIYFGGSQGVVAFDPERIRPVATPTPLRIVDLRINNQSLRPSDRIRGRTLLTRTPPFAQRVVLPYRASNIMFQFAALNYRSPLARRYIYRLRGFDPQWITTDATHRRATYTNLPPGTYHFEVQEEDYPSKGASLTVVVLAPWWGTLWFRGLIVLSLVAAVVGWNRWRHQSLLKQRATLQAEVASRTANLRQQSDTLLATNRALHKKRQEVEKQSRLVKQMAEEVHRSDQLKIRFFTQMSHEFRTPLTLILGPLQMGLNSKHLPRPVARQLRLMKRNAERLFTLINQLIDLNRAEEGGMPLRVAELDVIEKTRHIAEVFRPIAQQTNVALSLDLFVASHRGWLDYDKYEKILSNLLSNAFKFTPKGGNVRLEVRVQADSRGSFLQVRVRDSGIGLRPEQVERVFDHFYTTAAASPHQATGSGIGLALVKQLVQLHRGTIRVSPDRVSPDRVSPDDRATSSSFPSDGSGTTFVLRLPISKEHYALRERDEGPSPGEAASLLLSSPAPLSSSEFAAPVTRRPPLLVVDDNPDMCTFVHSVLALDYEVVTAHDGEAALEQLARITPALIISDVMMPGLDGIAFCRRVKAHPPTSHIPFVFLTAKTTEESELAGLRVGASDYIRKPFNVAVLQLKVKNVLATYQRTQRQINRGKIDELATTTLPPGDQAFLQRTLAVIQKHLAEPTLDAEFLARQLSISKSHLYKKIKALSGVSVHIFIRNQRLHRAAERLRAGQLVSEVAYEVGFNSLSYFTRCFSELHGQPPSSYRSALPSADSSGQ